MADVATTIGDNIERIRRLRQMTGKDLSARLKKLGGVSMSVATVSEVERAKRRVSAEELLIFAIALNTSVIDLLSPADGSPLELTGEVEPLPWSWLESWLSGRTPWPPDPSNGDYAEAFFATASEPRKLKHRTGMRPEVQELSVLRSAVMGAIEGPASWINEIDDPKVMADYLRDQLARVDSYVNLLADRLEKDGYGG